jgi:hypothetical protein
MLKINEPEHDARFPVGTAERLSGTCSGAGLDHVPQGFRRDGNASSLLVWQGFRMRRLTCFLGLILPLGLGATAAVADTDPPHKHYAVSHLPPDPNLATAKPMGRYRGFLRESIDLTPQMPPVRDQGELISGAAWAVAYAARSYYAGRNEGRNIESEENEASPNYVYNLARGDNCSEAATITSTVDVLKKGAVSLAAFPYKAECKAPPTTLVEAAKDFRVKGYHVLDRSHIDDIKGQLERGNPVVVHFRVSPAFQDFRGKGVFDEVDFDQAGNEDSWQTLTVIGYNDKPQAVRVMNSWGRGWGDDGYAWISYGTLTNRTAGAVVLDVAASQPLQAKKEEPKKEPDLKPKDEPKEQPKDLADLKPKDQPKDEADLKSKDEPKDEAELKSKDEPKDEADLKPKDEPKDEADLKSKDEPKDDLKKDEPIQRPKPKVKPTLADLRNLSCGKINEVRANGRVVLDGFVASDEDFDKVKEVASHEAGYSVGKITVAPWPLCEALGTLEKPLKAAALRPTLTTAPADVAKAGEKLRVELQAPARPTYVYLSYFTTDEKVITLVQPEGIIPRQTSAGLRQEFGDFTVGAPYGSEMIVAITSASPLFDSELPQIQTEREFLSALRKALIYKPVAKMPDREVGATIRFLKTEER